MVHTAEVDAGALVDGRYRVTRLLGAGGMSRVYLAHDDLLGRDVALKLFSSSLADEPESARRRDEVILLAGMNHPGLVVLFDAALDADPPYLTMEHVVGETLADRFARGALPPAEAEAVAIAIADALGFVHDNGIVHRDVKPGNILLPTSPASTAARAKLADFGIARYVDAGRMTATGIVIGTAAYISPEQAAGNPAGPPSDVYALGIVLIEALTGAHPYPGSALESAAARLAGDPDLSDPSLDPYRPLLQRMTARDPAARPAAAEVGADLAGTAHTTVMTPPDVTTAAMTAATVQEEPAPIAGAQASPPAHPATPSRRRTRRTALAALIAVLAIAVVIGVAMLGGAWPPTSEPRYPPVEGTLGVHLGQLQDAVEGTGLEDAVLAATLAAADEDFEETAGLIDVVAALADDAAAAGTLDSDAEIRIEAALVAIRADLEALIPPAGPGPEKPDPPGNGGGNGNGNGNNGNGNGNGGGKKD